jgi:hypothetical protein
MAMEWLAGAVCARGFPPNRRTPLVYFTVLIFLSLSSSRGEMGEIAAVYPMAGQTRIPNASRISITKVVLF